MSLTSEQALNAKHPAGLYLLSFIELWDRFSYYGLQSLLVLYLIKVFLFSDNEAYTLFAAYTGLTFATPIVGGLLADRLLGFYRASLIGAGLIILANGMLFFSNHSFLYIALAAYICGIGLFKPNNASLVGSLYKEHDARRGSGFTIFYIAMNAGALLGPASYGYVASQWGWNYGFALSAVGMFSAVILMIVKKNILAGTAVDIKSNNDKPRYQLKLTYSQFAYAGILVAIFLFSLILKKPDLFKNLLLLTAVLTIIGLISISIRSLPQERHRIIGLAILSFFCIFYFACYLQLATSLTLFIEREVHRSIFTWQVPTAMFLSLQPFFIILTAPLMAKLWPWLAAKRLEPSIPMKIALGLIFAGVSFVIFAGGAKAVNFSEKLPLLSVVVGNWTLGVGELLLMPVMMTAISQLAPDKLHGTFMGIFFLSEAFSSYLAGAIAKFIDAAPVHAGAALLTPDYAHGFFQLSYFMLCVGVVAALLTPWIKYLLRESND